MRQRGVSSERRRSSCSSFDISLTCVKNEEKDTENLQNSVDQIKCPLHYVIFDILRFYWQCWFVWKSLHFIAKKKWKLFISGAPSGKELTWYTLKVPSLILMKYTWWNWHAELSEPSTDYWNKKAISCKKHRICYIWIRKKCMIFSLVLKDVIGYLFS